MSNLTKEDQETMITMDALDRSAWNVYTSDPVYITKLNKIAAAITTTDWGSTYKLNARQVLLRNVPKKKRLSSNSLANLKSQ